MLGLLGRSLEDNETMDPASLAFGDLEEEVAFET